MRKQHLPFQAFLLLLIILLSVGCSRSEPEAATPSADVAATSEPQPSEGPEILPEITPKPSPSFPPEPSPEPTPEPTPQLSEEEILLAQMTLTEKLCRMLVVRTTDLDPFCLTELTAAAADRLESFPVGGIFFDSSNLVSTEQVRRMTAALQEHSAVPLLLMVDEEGGRVARLMNSLGTPKIGAMYGYRNDGPETAFSNAETIARSLADCGFNLDLAPVADVYSEPRNTVIGDRAYSDDFLQASELIPAAVAGFHAGGVGCTLKHFPGHGGTVEDSHSGRATVGKSAEALAVEELLPFRAGIEAGAEAVMIGHLTVPAYSDEPALLSPELVTGLLREALGFTGVVMTDALQMGALSGYSGREIAVGAVLAGVDLLLCPDDPAETVAALAEAVENGTLTVERIDESVLRLLRCSLALSER